MCVEQIPSELVWLKCGRYDSLRTFDNDNTDKNTVIYSEHTFIKTNFGLVELHQLNTDCVGLFIPGKGRRGPRSLLSLFACSRGYFLVAVPGPVSCFHAGRLAHQLAKLVVVNGAITVGVEIFHGIYDHSVVLVGPCARARVCVCVCVCTRIDKMCALV